MKDNKVLIKIIFPDLDKVFDLFIPVNEYVWKINKMITKSIFDMSGVPFHIKEDAYAFLNKNTGRVYSNNEIILNTDIRNGTEIIMLRCQGIQ